MRGPDLHGNSHTTVDPVTGHTHTTHASGAHTTTATTPVTPVAGVDSRVAEEIRRDAYRAGVADEKARHKRNPLVTILIALLAVLGLVIIVLYFVNGRSFSGAGQRLDAAASSAQDDVAAAGREVVDETGEGLQDAGRVIEQQGEGTAGTPTPGAATPAAPAGAQPAPAQ